MTIQTNDNKGVWTMTQAILDQTKAQAYREGVEFALNYLKELYESIDETDIWADYMEPACPSCGDTKRDKAIHDYCEPCYYGLNKG